MNLFNNITDRFVLCLYDTIIVVVIRIITRIITIMIIMMMIMIIIIIIMIRIRKKIDYDSSTNYNYNYNNQTDRCILSHHVIVYFNIMPKTIYQMTASSLSSASWRSIWGSMRLLVRTYVNRMTSELYFIDTCVARETINMM